MPAPGERPSHCPRGADSLPEEDRAETGDPPSGQALVRGWGKRRGELEGISEEVMSARAGGEAGAVQLAGAACTKALSWTRVGLEGATRRGLGWLELRGPKGPALQVICGHVLTQFEETI